MRVEDALSDLWSASPIAVLGERCLALPMPAFWLAVPELSKVPSWALIAAMPFLLGGTPDPLQILYVHTSYTRYWVGDTIHHRT